MAQTAISCQDVSARMMELLYGELAGDDRAALEAHVAGCASCRAELAGFQSTRAAARRALDADEPPARAHQAILRAASAAVAARQPQPIEARPVPARPSFWERLRGRWTFPTFATVGAVAVVVLASKVFLEPDKTVELGRQTLHPVPAEAPAPSPAQTAAQPETQEAAKAAPAAETGRLRRDADSWRQQHPAEDKAPARSSAAPAAHRHHDVAKEPLGSLGGLAKGGGAAIRAPAKAQLSDDALDDLIGGERADAPSGAPAAKSSKREFAPPPPPRAEPASPPATGSLRARDREMLEDRVEGNAPPRGNGGPVAGGAAPPAAHAGKAKKAAAPTGADLDGAPAASASAPAPVRAPAPAAPAAAADEERGTEKDSKKEDRAAAESPVARADRLFAGGHWAAAARAYRDLLRHDPNSADAARWRQRLAASEAAIAPKAPAAATVPAP